MMMNAMAAVAVALATTYIPETDVKTLISYPLKTGEAAYVQNGDGTATMLVGADGENGMRVADPYAIRGYAIETLARAEYSIAFGPGVSYDAARDYWTLGAGATDERIIVTPKGGREIVSWGCDAVRTFTPPSPLENVTITESVTNNSVVIAFHRNAAGEGGVSNIWLKCEAVGARQTVNDLTETTYRMRDGEGEYELGGLRSWARHLYDGNRGEDWASYPARHAVDLGGNRIGFGAGNRYKLAVDPTTTNFVLMANSRAMIRIYGGGGGGDGVAVTNFSRVGSTVTIGFDASAIAGFEAARMSVEACDDLREGGWEAVLASVGSGVVTVAGQTQPRRYYRLIYDGSAVADLYEVVVEAPVRIEDALYLRGDDRQLYRIRVSGGTITATAVN